MTPEYINENWTEELLALLFIKRNARLRRLNRVSSDRDVRVNMVSDTDLFARMGVTVPVVGRT